MGAVRSGVWRFQEGTWHQRYMTFYSDYDGFSNSWHLTTTTTTTTTTTALFLELTIFFYFFILGINLYLFLKFEVYYFTSLYHFNGCIVYDKNDHILSANIHRTRISSILIFFSRICHYLSEIQVSHRIQFQKNKNIDHHIEINSKKNSGLRKQDSKVCCLVPDFRFLCNLVTISQIGGRCKKVGRIQRIREGGAQASITLSE